MSKQQLTIEHIKGTNYSVSCCGRVFSKKRPGTKGGELKQFIVKGYKKVSFWNNGLFKSEQVHRLVAKAFIPNPENKPQVNHKDGDKLNNNVENLEWATAKENSIHSYNMGFSKSFWKGKKGYESTTGMEVHQYDLIGNYINSFGSMREASRCTGTVLSSICMCINNNLKTAGGYLWKQN